MRRPPTLAATILLAVIIISAANPSAATSSSQPSPRPKSESKGEQPSSHDIPTASEDAQATQPQAIRNAVPSQELQSATDERGCAHYGGRLSRLLTADPMTTFNGLLALFTFLLVVVGAFQLGVLYYSHKAAIHVGRPFLLVTEVHVRTVKDDQNAIFTADFTLHNFGTGPADIVDYIAEGDVFDAPVQNPDRRVERPDPRIAYGRKEGGPIGDPLVAPAADFRSHIVAHVSVPKSELAAMPDRRRIAFHGRVRYRGTLKQKYATRFFWWYFPEEDQCVQCLTKKYNSHT